MLFSISLTAACPFMQSLTSSRTLPYNFLTVLKAAAASEGFAEVAWNSAAGKCAGLRFTHLPEEEVREQIQIWSNQPPPIPPAPWKSLQPMETKLAPNGVGNRAPAEIHPLVADSTSLSPELPDADSSPAILSGISQEVAAETEGASPDFQAKEQPAATPRTSPLSMIPPEPERESESIAAAPRYAVPSRYGFVAIVVTVVLASIMAIAGLSYAYLHGTGKFLLQLADKIRDWF